MMKMKITVLGAEGRTVFLSATKTPSECETEAKEVPMVSWIYKSQLLLENLLSILGTLKSEFNVSHYFLKIAILQLEVE